MRKEEQATQIHEEAYSLIRNAPFISFAMTKFRLGYFDKMEHWSERNEGEIDFPGDETSLRYNFERRLLSFEQYGLDKVNQFLIIYRITMIRFFYGFSIFLWNGNNAITF